ncbi:nitroreductase family protein [Sanguibacter antarcticus]|uniref:Nitroreductase n=1 Tax=Sanguibacter antarcticus TaxID=372484 RepID=A0A2A9E0Z8_9MICO|nr:nitroreductase family protein [Sanguibacter antarcticus]PFG32524.1 nitroreductase [Sanguibacter antarcticus]
MIKKLKNIAKNLLAIPAVRTTYEGANRAVLAVGGSTRAGATGYSVLGFGTFNREQYAVLSGRRSYYRNLSQERVTHVELRRNVHRLEKGILMQPRRSSFAGDYILETVHFYSVAVRSGSGPTIDAAELQWAQDVLREYFAIVDDSSPAVRKAREQFEALDHLSEPGNAKPYAHSSIKRSDIDFDQMLLLAQQRRSVRWFSPRRVEREKIDRALEIGRQSPTACNRLPYEFRIFDDPAMVQKVAGIPFGAAGYSHQIPTIVVVVGRLDSYFSPRDRHAIYVDASLASMGFIYGLEAQGLSSSIINWPDFEPLEQKMSKTLHLAPHERVVMLMAVGYADPDSLVAYSQKKDLDVLRRYNVLEP